MGHLLLFRGELQSHDLFKLQRKNTFLKIGLRSWARIASEQMNGTSGLNSNIG